MHLKLLSPQETIFDGEVEKVVVPTTSGMITLLPHHTTLSSILTPGILRLVPKEKEKHKLIKDADFLFQDDEIVVSIGKGVLYIDGETTILLVSGITTNPVSDEKALEAMKINLEKELEEVKVRGDIDEIEKAYLSVQKITADLKLKKMRHG